MKENFDLKQLVKPLQTWFQSNARVLPWRENPMAYYVWISEIMLQQTRVEAVKPYYARFLETLPTVKNLAEADEEETLVVCEEENQAVKWFSFEEALKASTEKWFVDNVYAKLIQKCKGKD